MNTENLQDNSIFQPKYEEKFLEQVKKLNIDEELIRKFYQSTRMGVNKIFHNITSVAITTDESWLLTIENCLFYIENIIRNPKKFIKEEELVVNIEKAKRTTSKAVRYLCSHSQDISNIQEDGMIIPKRLVSSEMEEDLGIYENRFICTLVNRLINFIEERDREINGKLKAYQKTTIAFDTSFRYGKTDFSCKMELVAKEPPEDAILLEKNEEMAKKLIEVRKRLQIINETPFMRTLRTLKPVYPPINKTNILKMNVDYNHCYQLWLFISSYEFTGLSIETKEKELPVENDYFEDLAFLSAINLKSMIENEVLKRENYENIRFSPKKIKKYQILKKYNLHTPFVQDKTQASDSIINEYYYNRMQEAFKKAVNYKEKQVIVDEKEMKLSFSRFYRSVTHISNEMYNEIILKQKKKKDLKRKSLLQKKQEEFESQKTLYQRTLLLSQLKQEEYERTLRQVSKENIKLQELSNEYNSLLAKEMENQTQLDVKRVRQFKTVGKVEAIQGKEEEYSQQLKQDIQQSEIKKLKATDKLEKTLKKGYKLLGKIRGKESSADSINSSSQEITEENNVEAVSENAIQTEFYIKTSRSFSAKLIQSDEEVQEHYNQLKNYLAQYIALNNRISWEYETFTLSRVPKARIVLRGKTILFYLALDPKDYIGTKYKVSAVQDRKKYEQLPMLLKIKSNRGIKYAEELISIAFSEMEKQEIAPSDYHIPYQSDDELFEKGMIKKLKRKTPLQFSKNNKKVEKLEK